MEEIKQLQQQFEAFIILCKEDGERMEVRLHQLVIHLARVSWDLTDQHIGKEGREEALAQQN